MGFGSYDESEQDTQSIDSEDVAAADEMDTAEHEHDGGVDYEIGASNDELLDRLQEIKDQSS
ncbi:MULTISPECIES: DUF5786 family protein [Halobacterium]|uniref:DUF5786 domain-containing protein n=4 Tax=Halobacterium salinarum TaxID=2242 RepID=Q9HNJ1_HALSA|nr:MULTISPECIES: DUF5786 family protein [Halobacterium]AAG20229.1 hypothetical protein VNG_2081H [Halobacterium salinarum NRC-1]MBB6089244.1 hypothetical protein [Halobacterium salinarum]MCF2165848.1 death domain-associated protein [Halobacterium salinarum]MCF2167383.1 death domain-associated protein [Halobacterium salinarum]MCF2206567.1 death domain-associated protein [Halobacterium salinarum]